MDESNLLEHISNTVTKPVNEHGTRLEIAKCHCRSWFCPDCCKMRGYKLRKKLIPVLETFDGLIMASLTVDPTLFPDPKSAYFYTMDNRCISVTTQDLHRWNYLKTRRYFYVVEWQKKTEQAHYHILYDSRFIPFEELLRSWSKHRPENAGAVVGKRPPFGTVILTKADFESPVHAARYATKYLVKTPEHFPYWVMSSGDNRRIRRYSTNRGFWDHPSHRREIPTKTTRKNKRQTYADRILKCGESLHVFIPIEKVDKDTGEILICSKWYGQIKAPADYVLDNLFDPGNPKRRRRSLLIPKAGDIPKIIENITGQPAYWVNGGRNNENLT